MDKMGNDTHLHYAILVADLLLLCFLCTGYYLLMEHLAPQSLNGMTLLSILMTMVFSHGASFLLNPSVSQNRFASTEEVVRRVLVTVMLFLLFTVLITITIRPGEHFPRLFIFSFVAIYAVCLVTERLLMRTFFQRLRVGRKNLKHVVLVGNAPAIHALHKYLSQPAYGYSIAAAFYDHDLPYNEDLAQLRQGRADDIYEWLIGHPEINEIYVHAPMEDTGKVNFLGKYCDNNLIRLYYVPDIGVFNGNYTLERRGETIIIARRDEPLTRPLNRIIKRTFDLVTSSIFLACVYPFIYVVVALLIKRQSPGPVYFKQARTGIDGKVFQCIKFRSMHINAEADTMQATKDDPRKFPFGNFMRKTNIDELPQLINVWKGEMSLVGPRPHMLRHTEEYSKIINRFMVRHLAKPGITGLAQVSGFRGETRYLDQMEGRVRKDIEYIENWSFLLDLKILLKTFTNMLGGEKNAY